MMLRALAATLMLLLSFVGSPAATGAQESDGASIQVESTVSPEEGAPGTQVTISSVITITSESADANSEDSGVAWTTTLLLPEGLAIFNVDCVDTTGTSCEVDLDPESGLVTITGAVEEDSLGEDAEARVFTIATVDLEAEASSELSIESCATLASASGTPAAESESATPDATSCAGERETLSILVAAEPAATEEPAEEPAATPEPTEEPTATAVPTEEPTEAPTATTVPTEVPTETPEPTATAVPTEEPTETPEPTATAVPTEEPTETPEPTATAVPTEEPTETPEPTATAVPTEEPTEVPTATTVPTEVLTEEPTEEPTATAVPTEEPTATTVPTEEPTATPTEEPTATTVPTEEPTATTVPTEEPTATTVPTEEPTATPESTATTVPTEEPTATTVPTEEPTATTVPTEEPTATTVPTEEPTATPESTATTVPTEEPTATTVPTEEPTATTVPTEEPTATTVPTEEPTATPEPTATTVPTEEPTATTVPTEEPTATTVPTEEPTATTVPTEEPTEAPTETPEPTATTVPTEEPTATTVPTEEPTATTVPTEEPTEAPTETPEPTATTVPTEEPTIAPAAVIEPTVEIESEVSPDGDEVTISSVITLDTSAAEPGQDLTFTFNETVPEGLTIDDAVCPAVEGVTCEVAIDDETGVVTVSGTVDEDAVGETLSVQLDVTTSVDEETELGDSLSVEICSGTSEGDSCAADDAPTENVEVTLEAPEPTAAPVADVEPTVEIESQVAPGGDEVTISSVITVDTSSAESGQDLTFTFNETVPEGLTIDDAVCPAVDGVTCEVTIDEAAGLVTVTGTVDEDAVGGTLSVQLDVTTSVDEESDLAAGDTLTVDICTGGSEGTSCTADDAATENVELTLQSSVDNVEPTASSRSNSIYDSLNRASTPTLGLPSTGHPTDAAGSSTLPLILGGGALLILAIGCGLAWQPRRTTR